MSLGHIIGYIKADNPLDGKNIIISVIIGFEPLLLKRWLQTMQYFNFRNYTLSCNAYCLNNCLKLSNILLFHSSCPSLHNTTF